MTSPGAEKYKVVSPETMVEAMMTDSENEDGELPLVLLPVSGLKTFKVLEFNAN